MLWGDERRLCVLYALTPIHAGAGQALKAVDLPIQRERHTAWPIVQASGIKGALRDWCETAWRKKGFDKSLVDRIFGKAGEQQQSWAGAITVTDAKILAFPVRSQVSPFVHVASPAVLRRLSEDLRVVGKKDIPSVESVSKDKYVTLKGEVTGDVILEDIVVRPADHQGYQGWGNILASLAPDVDKLLLVSDGIFSYLVRNATEVQAHIAIEHDTGTTEDGSLRYQEYLPTDSVLYFLALFADERSKLTAGESGGQTFLRAREIAERVTTDGVSAYIQIGGDFTLGKGICKVQWISPDNLARR